MTPRVMALKCVRKLNDAIVSSTAGEVQALLDDIGLNGKRLSLYNLHPGDTAATDRIVREVLGDVTVLGRNPAAPN
jgi:predicted naringenin-chalcone synthase